MKKTYCVCACSVFSNQDVTKLGRHFENLFQCETRGEALEFVKSFDAKKFWDEKSEKIFKHFKDAEFDRYDIEFTSNHDDETEPWIDTQAAMHFRKISKDKICVVLHRYKIVIFEIPSL